MSLLSNQQLTTTGTKQYGRGVEFQFSYVIANNNSSNKAYFDNSTLYPQTLTTATATSVSPGISGEYDYSPTSYDASTLSGVPVVDQARNGIKLTSTAINGKVDVAVKWDLTYDRYVVLAIRSASGTGVAGKLVIESSTGNSLTQSFTANTTIGQQQIIILDRLNATVTGSIVLASITKLTVSLDASATSVDLLGAYTTSEKGNVIGAKVDMRFECIADVTEESQYSATDIFCRQLLKDTIPTKDGAMYKVKVKKISLDALAAGLSTVPTQISVQVQTVVNSDVVGKVAIATNTLTIATGQRIAYVGIGEMPFESSPVTTASNLVENEYHYNSSTGVITFGSGYNGKIPTVVVWETSTITAFDHIALSRGVKGFLWMPNETTEGRQFVSIIDSARMSIGAKSPADDGDEREISFTVIANTSGKLRTYGVR